jgi:branched-chain amino acid transport system substrate-binding protein
MLRIGILLPRSTLFPSVSIDILNGTKACLSHYKTNEDFKLLTDNIGFGTNAGEVYAKAEKLLLQEDADIVIVFADVQMVEMLGPLFKASNKLLMMVNFGAGFPDSWHPVPNTLVHSLNFCLHTRLTGKMAAKQTNKQAAYVASFYDSGYRQCYSFMNGHQQNGGIPCYTHITHFKEEAFTLAPLEVFLKQHKEVKSLLCLFAGDQAAKFYREAATLQQQYGLDFYVSPMMLDEQLKDWPGEKFNLKNTKGYTPWVSKLNNESNLVFKLAYEKTINKKANLFALLGWETGMLLNCFLHQYKAGISHAVQMPEALGNITIDSPRGWLKLDAATNHTYGSSWLVSCNSNMEVTIDEEAFDIEKEWKAFTNEIFPTGESSHWRNTYLCI